MSARHINVSLAWHDLLNEDQKIVINNGYVYAESQDERRLTISLCDNERLSLGFFLPRSVLRTLKNIYKGSKTLTIVSAQEKMFTFKVGHRIHEESLHLLEDMDELIERVTAKRALKASSEHLGLVTESNLRRALKMIDTSSSNTRYNGAYVWNDAVYATDGIVAIKAKANPPKCVTEFAPHGENEALPISSKDMEFLLGSIRVTIKGQDITYFARNRILTTHALAVPSDLSAKMPPIDQLTEGREAIPITLSKAFYPYYKATEHLKIEYNDDLITLSEHELRKKFRVKQSVTAPIEFSLSSRHMAKLLTKHCSPQESMFYPKLNMIRFLLGDAEYYLALRR